MTYTPVFPTPRTSAMVASPSHPQITAVANGCVEPRSADVISESHDLK